MDNEPNNTLTICAFGASSQHIHPDYINHAYQLGQLMAHKGWQCVNGAGAFGLMRAISDGILDAGGHSIGVIPKFMVDNGWAYDRLTEIIITADMHERKQLMHDLSHAVVALPGGCGTLEELLEAITWRQLGLLRKPIILLNTRGFFDPLTQQLQRCINDGFMHHGNEAIWTTAETPEQAIAAIEAQLPGASAQQFNKQPF